MRCPGPTWNLNPMKMLWSDIETTKWKIIHGHTCSFWWELDIMKLLRCWTCFNSTIRWTCFNSTSRLLSFVNANVMMSSSWNVLSFGFFSRKTLVLNVLNLFQKSWSSLSDWYQKIYNTHVYIYIYMHTVLHICINYVYLWLHIKAYASWLHVTAIKLWSPCPRQSKVDCFGSMVPIKFNSQME